jgi:ribose transport system permease protein
MAARMKNTTTNRQRREPETTAEDRAVIGRSWRGYAARARVALFSAESSLLLVLVVLALIGVFWILLRDTGFMSLSNFMNIVRQTTAISVMAVATVFVISAGEIDLSFASVPPVSGLVAAMLLEQGNPAMLAAAAALSTGLLIGLVNGAITVLVGIPSFIVTLGMIGVLEGLARLISQERAIPIVDQTFTAVFGSGSLGPVPVLLLWTLGIGALGAITLRRTPFGKAVLATGGNEMAARYSGIRTGRIKITVLVLSSLAGALAGLLYTGQLASARYDLGAADLLTTLAAVIIGGTTLSGGRGFVVGAVAGSLLVGLVNNGVILLGFSTPQQQIFTGLIIVMAVALSAHRGGRRGTLR